MVSEEIKQRSDARLSEFGRRDTGTPCLTEAAAMQF